MRILLLHENYESLVLLREALVQRGIARELLTATEFPWSAESMLRSSVREGQIPYDVVISTGQLDASLKELPRPDGVAYTLMTPTNALSMLMKNASPMILPLD